MREQEHINYVISLRSLKEKALKSMSVHEVFYIRLCYLAHSHQIFKRI